MEQDKRFLNIHEVAGYLGVSRWTIYKLVSQRRLTFIALSKRTLRFDRMDVDKFMEKQKVKTLAHFVEQTS